MRSQRLLKSRLSRMSRQRSESGQRRGGLNIEARMIDEYKTISFTTMPVHRHSEQYRLILPPLTSSRLVGQIKGFPCLNQNLRSQDMVSVQTMTQPPKTRCVPGAIKSFIHVSGLISFDLPSSHIHASKVRFPSVLHLSGLQLSVFHDPYTTYPASQDEKRHLASVSSAAATADNLVIASLGGRLEQLAW